MTTYAYLGPAGTFTEAALRQISKAEDVLVPYSNVTAALDAVRDGKAEKVLVPIENSVEGVVSRTLDELAVGTPLVVTAETTLPVSFSLMVLPENIGKPITIKPQISYERDPDPVKPEKSTSKKDKSKKENKQ